VNGRDGMSGVFSVSRRWSWLLQGAARFFAFGLVVALIATSMTATAMALASDPGVRKGSSGLPVPRFVSLKASRVNVRIGPGEDYKIAWVFTRPGLPLEIIQEYDTWRRIRDSDGTVGWVFQSLLSGKRTAVVAPWASDDARPIRATATADAAITAYLEPGVLAEIEECQDGWCQLAGANFLGWITQDQLWGVYPGETVDERERFNERDPCANTRRPNCALLTINRESGGAARPRRRG
jgi:SH3-like domain-containing protein